MVKIINGEIVQDDDPRAVEWARLQSQRQSVTQRRQQTGQGMQGQGQGMGLFGGLQGAFGSGQGRQEPQPAQAQQSPFQGINEKLAGMGIPRWNIGQNVVEPLFSVIFVLALIFYGVRGLLMAGLLWFMFGRNV